ncbi:MAG: ATP-binding protein [Phenylobacterium sp. RIFCSPHIGHO2_01_FULL_69_31]|uniref:sce7725 family protein n=1 Tax=Phenylobacterium sp. RIFCSPHIGHO2_01_FULL_69_31 TaxID=1801944 RepID=UPI0008CC6C84|nr:sce7725 family protein [Phenylobacterium sp. RIFCSPHIGHO2_01_FULL_69_31]OHB28921.1 MAG: ATP-binding protein [Phenylobacterium sp. RIFCSPHIGHO2_01_FULL_69_31]
MYYPYFRGKQFELITVRETAAVMAAAGFVPIIEPVKETLNGLDRALKAVCEAGGNAIVIVNPYHGDHSDDGAGISTLLRAKYLGKGGISAGILLKEHMSRRDALGCYKAHEDHRPVFVHAGFTDGKGLAEDIGDILPDTQHVFFEKYCGTLYRKHFRGSRRILLRDGFERRRNADHPPMEVFSELHLTYADDGMDGFGDFLIVGDDFTEGGGPAYAVAIHLTFINPEKDDVMYIYHFVSDSKDTPTDPAGKFAQALAKLIKKLDGRMSHLEDTSAITEFRDLYAKKHFPGLGQVKKLSMIHHVETLARYLS